MSHAVLVIEDDDAIAQWIAEALTGEGYEVVCAVNGAGLAHAMHRPPDLIILDMLMPGMDGWTVRRKLLEFGPTEHVPVILMTALNASDQWKDDLRAVDLLRKPFSLNRLFESVAAAIGPPAAAKEAE